MKWYDPNQHEIDTLANTSLTNPSAQGSQDTTALLMARLCKHIDGLNDTLDTMEYNKAGMDLSIVTNSLSTISGSLTQIQGKLIQPAPDAQDLHDLQRAIEILNHTLKRFEPAEKHIVFTATEPVEVS